MTAAGLRLFIAGEVTDAVRSAYSSLRDRWNRSIQGARWTRPDALHLTFKFLGSTAEERLAEIGESLRACAARSPRFTLRTEGPGVFGVRTRPRVLWVSVGGATGVAASLAGLLEEAFERLGFPREDRPLRMHLTLARFDLRSRAKIPDALLAGLASEMAGLELPVEEIVLFQSRPAPGGSIYLPRERYPLMGASAP